MRYSSIPNTIYYADACSTYDTNLDEIAKMLLEKLLVAGLSIVGTLVATVIIAYFRRARDKVELKAKISFEHIENCHAMVATDCCSGPRTAKLKGVSIRAKLFAIHATPKTPDAETVVIRDPIVSFDFTPLSVPTNEYGFVLERDDICKFALSTLNGAVPLLAKVPSEELILQATLFDGTIIKLLSGIRFLECVRELEGMRLDKPIIEPNVQNKPELGRCEPAEEQCEDKQFR